MSLFHNQLPQALQFWNNNAPLEEDSALIIDREALVLGLMHVCFDVFD
jgi:hypothetical protein